MVRLKLFRPLLAHLVLVPLFSRALVVGAEPKALQPDPLWMEIARATYIVRGRLHLPGVKDNPSLSTGYVRLKLTEVTLLKAHQNAPRLNGRTLAFVHFAKDSPHNPGRKWIRSQHNRDVVAFLTIEPRRSALYLDYGRTALLRADQEVVDRIRAEVRQQTKLLESYSESVPAQSDKYDAQVKEIIESFFAPAPQSSARSLTPGWHRPPKGFTTLENLGWPAVPAMIRAFDDRRHLGTTISLENKSAQAFEGVSHYNVENVLHALDAILEQITGDGFGHSYGIDGSLHESISLDGWRLNLLYDFPNRNSRGANASPFSPGGKMIGFAGSTTGGGNATPTKLTTFGELSAAAQDAAPRVILVSGTIKTEGGYAMKIASNKTILGADKHATIHGGLAIQNSTNIILRNFNLKGTWPDAGPDDALALRHAHHIWIDHLNIWDAGDGNLDITAQSSQVTVSWCKFWYTEKRHPHRFCALIGSGGGDHPEDWGKLKVTYHHNWFADLVDQRMPRLMYGQAHIFNNYYTSTGNNYCIGVGSYGAALIENNYFKAVHNPHTFMYNVHSHITARGNIYEQTTGKQDSGAGGHRHAPNQNFQVTPLANVPYNWAHDK